MTVRPERATQPLVQTATIHLPEGGDPAAPGAAVTVALCGHWEHDRSCRWPHHTSRRHATWAADRLEVRVVVVAPVAEVSVVRAAVVSALSDGVLASESGTATWALLETAAGVLTDEEQALAHRLRGT